MLELFPDYINSEFKEWKDFNGENFTWWSYVNMKSDLDVALGFAKFFCPDIIIVEGCFLLKDRFFQDIYVNWKEKTDNNKNIIERMMNLYSLRDFFHINDCRNDYYTEKIDALGLSLKYFWNLSFKDRFPNKKINIEIIDEGLDDDIFITVYECD